MPVNTTHPCYDARLCDWQLVRDCIAGKNAIICGGEKYLPRLAEQDDAAYEGYQKRAKWFNATARTQESMVGILFRKEPTVETDLSELIQWDLDMGNTPLVQYAAKIANDVTSVGRAGTLVDWSEKEGRPYVSYYRAEDILNWQTARINGRQVLTMLVLRECVLEESSDPYLPTEVEQFRVLRLDFSGERPTVLAEVYRGAPKTSRRQAATKASYLLTDVFPMERRGEPLPEIPFTFHNASEAGPEISKPPLYDIAELNTGHWRNSADLENGRHVAGVPTPYACGFEAEGKLYLGTSHAWTSEDVQAKAGFVEFSGQGLDALVKALEETTQQMEALGARMISPSNATEAYGTVALRNAAENSSITKIADQISDSMTRVLGWMEFWIGTMPSLADTTAEFHVHKDFNSVALTPEEMTGLTNLWQQNAISFDTLFEKLQRGEVIPEGRTMEEEQELIDANPPMPAPKALPGILPGQKPPEEKAPPDDKAPADDKAAA
jgi:hypothetical protein